MQLLFHCLGSKILIFILMKQCGNKSCICEFCNKSAEIVLHLAFVAIRRRKQPAWFEIRSAKFMSLFYNSNTHILFYNTLLRAFFRNALIQFSVILVNLTSPFFPPLKSKRRFNSHQQLSFLTLEGLANDLNFQWTLTSVEYQFKCSS